MARSTLFEIPEPWEEAWEGMPEFIQEDQESFDSIVVHFRNAKDRRKFLMRVGEDPARRKSIWYPRMEYLRQSERDTEPTEVKPNRYPIYVISKGRWESRLTVKALEHLGIPHWVVIEPQEHAAYANVMDPDKILVLPFRDLGKGSIPARNWVWEHSLAQGDSRHWILDDNLDGFYRLNRNLKTKVVDENPFSAMENFADRYTNVAIAGLNYEFFATRRSKQPPFRLNTRVYSCILIQNDIPYRWRGRYNEDTDLCIRALKDGWCTVLFNAFLCKKMPTMTMKGGNTEDLYEIAEGRLKMAQSLQEQHPDIVTIVEKWGRWQHHVDYRGFKKNRLKLKEDMDDGSPH